MPKSKRAKVVTLAKTTKKARERKDKLFAGVREAAVKFQHCFVLAVDGMRNNHLKDVRHELKDSRLFFGKTKLMAKALGPGPEDAPVDGIHALTPYLNGVVGLLFTNRDPSAVQSYFSSLVCADFARAGAVAPRGVSIPPGPVYSTGGEVALEDDVPLAATLEPELRRLGMPTRLLQGRIVLGEEDGSGGRAAAYEVCREGQTLDGRQTRLLKLFSICLAEFRVMVRAYWSAANGEVTEVEGMVGGAGGLAGADDEKMDEDA